MASKKVQCRVCLKEVPGRASPDDVHGDGKYPAPHKNAEGEECPGSQTFAVDHQPVP